MRRTRARLFRSPVVAGGRGSRIAFELGGIGGARRATGVRFVGDAVVMGSRDVGVRRIDERSFRGYAVAV